MINTGFNSKSYIWTGVQFLLQQEIDVTFDATPNW